MLPSRFKRTLVTAAMAPALGLPAAVLAENTAQQQSQQPTQQSLQLQPQQGDIRMSRLNGMPVQNAQGEDIGEVKDIVVDANSGEVAYVALSHGGFLGIGEDLFAYPVARFEMGAQGETLVLKGDVTQEQLEEREGFNDGNWPKLRQDRDYWAQIDQRFGAEGSASAGGTAQGAAQERAFVRGSELVGESVTDRADNAIGEIDDLVVSLRDGEVRFAAIDTAGDDKLVPVPMDALSVREDGSGTAVRYQRDRMDLSQAFDEDEWPL